MNELPRGKHVIAIVCYLGLALLSYLAGRGLPRPAAALRVPRVAAVPMVAVAVPASEVWQLVRVGRVLDADTYAGEMAGGTVRLRLAGVDAPELGQPFGRAAADSVRRLLRGKYVWVQPTGTDGYGRTLCAVRVRPGAFSPARAAGLDSLLVARGWAWAYAPGGAVPALAALELAARDAGRGLWKCGAAGVVRPGIWRALTKQEKAVYLGVCDW